MMEQDGVTPKYELQQIMQLPDMKSDIVDMGTIQFGHKIDEIHVVENYYMWELEKEVGNEFGCISRWGSVNMEKVVISIIIPVYQVKLYLRECLESVRSQTYKNLEIILVDDGSDDGSEIICDEYAGKDSRFHVIHQSNRGTAYARKVGVRHSTGEYIGFIDGDDWVSIDIYKNVDTYIYE